MNKLNRTIIRVLSITLILSFALLAEGQVVRKAKIKMKSKTTGPKLRVTAPNGGEKLKIKSNYLIKWSATRYRGRISIKLAAQNQPAIIIAKNIKATAGSFNWAIGPKVRPGRNYRILVVSADNKLRDQSDNVFSIIAPAKPKITVRSQGAKTRSGDSSQQDSQQSSPPQPPADITLPGCENGWCIGQQYTIQWNTGLFATANVKIQTERSYGGYEKIVVNSTPNTGSYNWTILPGNYNFGQGFQRVVISTPDNSVVIKSDQFMMGKPISVLAPKSNHTWRKGSRYQIRWLRGCNINSGDLDIQLLDSAKNVITDIDNFMWVVPANLQSGTYYIKISTADGSFDEESFTIDDPPDPPLYDPNLTFIEPDGDTRWCIEKPNTVRWNTLLPANADVKIEVITSWDEIRHTITGSTLNTGSLQFTIPSANFNFGMGSYRLRISTLDDSAVTESDLFIIGKPLSLSEPKSNRIWRKGSQYSIRWLQVCDLSANLNISLLDSNHQKVADITSGLSASANSVFNSYQWTVPTNLTAGTYYIKIATSDNQISKESSFTIAD